MVDSHTHTQTGDDSVALVRRIRELLANNQTAAAGQAIHLLRLRFPNHPELEDLEAEREALYHPVPEPISPLEDILQSLPSARILVPIGGLIVGVGILTLVAKELGFAIGLVVLGILVILVALVRARVEDGL